MRLARVLSERDTAKSLAMLLQQAYMDVLEWNLKLGYKHGYVYGELVTDSGQPHGDVITFIDGDHLYTSNREDFDAAMSSQDPFRWMTSHPEAIYMMPRNGATREWAEAFVKEYHGRTT